MTLTEGRTVAQRLPESFQKEVDANRSLQKMVLRIQRQGGSLETCQGYVYDVVEFGKYLGGTPDEILGRGFDWAKELNTHLDDLVVVRGVSPATAIRRVSGVKRWLTVNEVAVLWDRVEVPKKEVVETDQLPTKVELREAYQAADLFDRVLMLTAISSGLRVGSIAKVQLKDVDLEREIPVVRPPKEITKGRKSFVTFLTPEAKQAIGAYLKQRELRGEKLGPDSYLLACERPRGKQVSKHSLTWRWKVLLKRVGLFQKGERMLANGQTVPAKRNLRHIHVLRKFFKTWATFSGMNTEATEFVMGHRSGVRATYFNPDTSEGLERLTTEYAKAVPALEVLNESEAIKEMEGKLEGQAKELKELRERRVVDSSVMDMLVALQKDKEEDRALLAELQAKIREMQKTGQPAGAAASVPT